MKGSIAAGVDLDANADRLSSMLWRMAKKGHDDLADLLRIFTTEITGGTLKWPVLSAALSRQHTVQKAINRKRCKTVCERHSLRTRPR